MRATAAARRRCGPRWYGSCSHGRDVSSGSGERGDELEGFDVPIVVHSHLRWSGIWQRPQQTHSRLARHHPITFIEEPVCTDCEPFLEFDTAPSGVLTLRPHLPRRLLADRVMGEQAITRLLRQAATRFLVRRTRHAVHWLYTPMMRPQLAAFPPAAAVIYDCMDELSGFLGAPPELLRRETALLGLADAVFCGGPALYDAKSRHHGNVHDLGCGVDFAHFHGASERPRPHAALAALPAPRIGYVGAIDERLDYALLDALAALHPEWSIVLVGPVVKVDPAILPQRANVHALGARAYEELPALLAGFDVCLMPFALNEATAFINPTKTLEYLASGRPVVSTPVRDVVRRFSDVVTIAAAHELPSAIAELLARGAHDPSPGLARARDASWDAVVGRMRALTHAAIGARERRRAGSAPYRSIGASTAPARPA